MTKILTDQSFPWLHGRRAVVVVYSYYPTDPRVRRAAEALSKEGAIVELICLQETDDEPLHEVLNGVNITRIPRKRRRGGILSYLAEYGAFILIAGLILTRRTIRRRFDLVHVHNMPDFLVFSALIPKLFGAKVILDLHDPMPELMRTLYGLQENSCPVRLLKVLERWSQRFADAIVTVNEACAKIFSERGCAREKITVVMNAPDEEIFPLRAASPPVAAYPDKSKRFILMYHGQVVERHGLDIAVKALTKIRKAAPGAELRVCAPATPFLAQVMELVRTAGLSEAVRYLGPMTPEQIAAAISESDAGIIPNRRSIFTELNTPTRIFEYLSQGKVAIAPRAPGILDYFGPQDLVFFELGDSDDLAAKIEYVLQNSAEAKEIIERGQEVYRAHTWSAERLRFMTLVQRLLQAERFSAVQAQSVPVTTTQALAGNTRSH